MKLCNGCNIKKPADLFSKLHSSSDGRARACKECNGRWRVTHYQKHKKRLKKEVKDRKETIKTFVREQRQVQCLRCLEDHPGTIDFHHRDPSTKEFEIGDAWARGISMDKIIAEIAKCDPLCANCHRKLHYEERLR